MTCANTKATDDHHHELEMNEKEIDQAWKSFWDEFDGEMLSMIGLEGLSEDAANFIAFMYKRHKTTSLEVDYKVIVATLFDELKRLSIEYVEDK